MDRLDSEYREPHDDLTADESHASHAALCREYPDEDYQAAIPEVQDEP